MTVNKQDISQNIDKIFHRVSMWYYNEAIDYLMGNYNKYQDKLRRATINFNDMQYAYSKYKSAIDSNDTFTILNTFKAYVDIMNSVGTDMNGLQQQIDDYNIMISFYRHKIDDIVKDYILLGDFVGDELK